MSVLPASQWLLWLAAATMVIAAFMAMSKNDLKARLAWSTIGQLALIVSAALLPIGGALVAGGLQIVAHAVGKITLFFCAGAIYVATGASRVSELSGLGRRMPVTFACFLVGALSVVGLPPLPPFAGLWPKFLLITASFGSQEWITAAAMILSTLLSLFYLAPVAIRGLLPPASDPPPADFIRPGAPGLAVAPAIMTAVACIALFFFADAIVAYLAPIEGGAP
jgi:multicomponent Na+:H+ antiporter subunit D